MLWLCLVGALRSVSHNQFIQIVHALASMKPSAWLRKLKTDRAHELLKYSDMPIKMIAFRVGIPDLLYFNKIIRKEYGSGAPLCD